MVQVTRPRLLDLFCGAGGAGMGYHRAGFEVTGVDLHPQPNYPFTFVQADAMTFPLEGYDVIHASPPCQAYSAATPSSARGRHPDLYEATRERLAGTGVPWVLENVIGAPYQWGVRLCGSMFALEEDGEWLRRHRNFELSHLLFQPPCTHPPKRPVMITSKAFISEIREYRHSRQVPFEVAKRVMGIDWMTRRELAQSIPPAYTEWIGRELGPMVPFGWFR